MKKLHLSIKTIIAASFSIIIIACIIFLLYSSTFSETKITSTATTPTPTTIDNQTDNLSISNPAAAFCQAQGGANEIITAADGSESGRCVFPDGRKCDDWEFFRTKECN